MRYQHLTMEKRYHIQAYKSTGYRNSEIAKMIGVNPSTIGRELKRNSSSQRGIYSAKSANNVSKDRRMYASRVSNKKLHEEAKNIIDEKIREDWSPEQISNRLKQDGKLDISYVRIYQYIEEDRLQGGDFIYSSKVSSHRS